MLTILGQSGGPTQLSANDDVFGVMTQVPTGAVKHSADGLVAASGNTAFGSPFDVQCFTSQAASADTDVDLCSSDCPYKMRILSVTVECADDGKGAATGPTARVAVGVSQGGSSSCGSVDVTDLKTGERRELPVGRFSANDVIPADGSLRVSVHSSLATQDKAYTYKLIVTLRCQRVV